MTVQIRHFTSACTILQNSLVLMCNKNWYFFANKLGLPNKTSHEQGNNFLKTIHFYSCVMFSIFLLNFGFCKTVWKTYLLLDVCQTTTPMYPPKKFYMYIHLLQPRVWTMIPCQFWVRHHCFASFTNFFLCLI